MRKLAAVGISALLALSLAGCAGSSNAANDSGLNDGTYTSQQQGFGGPVTVTLTIADGKISDVELVGDSETPSVGGAALDTLKENILSSNSADFDLVSGATYTSTAVQKGVADDLAQAAGTASSSAADAVVADGTYNGKAPSFGIMKEMELAVTFKDNKITDIETVCAGSATQADEDEYSAQYKTVEDNLYPRIIASQSLAVDSISGATVSSNAAKSIIANIIDENGGDSSQWYTPVEKSTKTVTLDGYDAIIVGLGSSGVATYLSAALNGATVFGMETAAKIGGNGTNTAGPLGVNPQAQVEANGGEKFVDEDELFNAWMEYTDNDAKPDIVKMFINESGKTFGWLEDNYDFSFLPQMFAFYDAHGWKLWTIYSGKDGGTKDDAYVNSMEKAKAMNDKNDYMTELTAKKLLVEDGKVVGVEAEYYDGTIYDVYGDSVVLADGGFIGNAEMTQKYTGAVWHTKGMTQCNGFGINAALDLGAALYNPDVAVEDHIAALDTIIRSDDYSDTDKSILSSLVNDMSYTMIGSKGNEFDPNYNGLGISFNAWEAGANYYVLLNEDEYNAIKNDGYSTYTIPMFFSQVTKDTTEFTNGDPVTNLDDIMAMGEKFNDVYEADSLAELGDKLGITINLNNVHGRSDGRFYAIKGAAYVYSTCGGLDIDTNINVLKEDGTPIDNLYAVGNNSLGTLNESNKAYVTYGGCAQGWALTSGRLVGQTIAEKYTG